MDPLSSNLPERLALFNTLVTPCDYSQAVEAVMSAAGEPRSFGVTALAVHGLMLAARDHDFRAVVNSLDLVTPDGQPVRWALNHFCGTTLRDRVYGPRLMELVCEEAARNGVPIYLFGSSALTCERLNTRLRERWPTIDVVGVQPDRFREASAEEDAADVASIRASQARIVFVGRGCPRQERWVAAHIGAVPAVMVAVGAAFDYLAEVVKPPAPWMQKAGLEWLHRLIQEPGRLWKRYLTTNSTFLYFVAKETWRRTLRRRAGCP